MSVYWVQVNTENALEAMAAVEQALRADNAAASPTPSDHEQVTPEQNLTDHYLAENLAVAQSTWAIDPQRIVGSNRRILSGAINAFQRLARRGSWWYNLPQWLQVNEFNASVVRMLEALLAYRRDLEADRAQLVGRIGTLEQQVSALRAEQRVAQLRIADLENRLAAMQPASQPSEVQQ